MNSDQDPTAPEPAPAYDEYGHELDTLFEPIHIDVDPVIPTGICRHCPKETDHDL